MGVITSCPRSVSWSRWSLACLGNHHMLTYQAKSQNKRSNPERSAPHHPHPKKCHSELVGSGDSVQISRYASVKSQELPTSKESGADGLIFTPGSNCLLSKWFKMSHFDPTLIHFSTSAPSKLGAQASPAQRRLERRSKGMATAHVKRQQWKGPPSRDIV